MGNLIKRDSLRLGELFKKGWPRKFCSETFYNGYENFNTNAKSSKRQIFVDKQCQ
jgi:hypothetical protein